MKKQNAIFSRIVFPLISIFFVYLTYILNRIIWDSAAEKFSFIFKFLLSALVNLSVTGTFAFIGFSFKSSNLLSDKYYNIKYPAILKRTAGILGIEYFRELLLLVYWGKNQNRKKYFDGTKKGISNLVFQTKQSEFGHLISLIVVQITTVLMIIKGHYTIAIITTLINFLFNFYPVILQRLHRMKIERINSKLDKNSAA